MQAFGGIDNDVTGDATAKFVRKNYEFKIPLSLTTYCSVNCCKVQSNK